jgi:hypothetical protein
MNKSRRVRWMGQVAGMRKIRNVFKNLIKQHNCKRQLGILKCKLEDNIKTNLKKIVCDWHSCGSG